MTGSSGQGKARKRRVEPARRLAYRVLRAVSSQGAYANLELAHQLHGANLDRRDAAFATELVAGVCRAQDTYDRVIEAASGRTKLDDDVRDVLRLTAHQLLATRVPAHAAIATSVDLAVVEIGKSVGGFVNAIGHKIAARDLAGWLDELTSGLDTRDALAVRSHHPRWIVDAFADVLPADELEAALMADNVAPATNLVVRPGWADLAELVAAGAVADRYSPYGATYAGRPDDVAAVSEGRAGVQDEGSALVAAALAGVPGPDGPWLDLCAGPGGKAALLAGLAAEAGTRLVAAELQAHRASLVRQALAVYDQPVRRGTAARDDEAKTAGGRADRASSRRPAGQTRPADSNEPAWSGRGRTTQAVIVADGTRPPFRSASFAKLMVDAPCSGLGALRRRPDARWRRQPADVDALVPLQRALLASAVELTMPGGVVAYVTCSPHRAETEEVVATVDPAKAELLCAADQLPGVPDAIRAGDFVQLWPHRHSTDAMFLALLRRR